VRLATAVDANGLTIFLMATVWLVMQSLAELLTVSNYSMPLRDGWYIPDNTRDANSSSF
jgi:hypothetical protein